MEDRRQPAVVPAENGLRSGTCVLRTRTGLPGVALPPGTWPWPTARGSPGGPASVQGERDTHQDTCMREKGTAAA